MLVIKSELEKLGAAFEQNMKRTVQEAEAKTAIMATRTLSFKDSLDRLTAKYADLMRETDKLKAENQTLQQTNTGLQQANTGLQQANTGLQQANTGLQQENQDLQQQLITKSTPFTPTSILRTPSFPKDGATKISAESEDDTDDSTQDDSPVSTPQLQPSTSTKTVVRSVSFKGVSPILAKSPSTKQPEPLSLETPGTVVANKWSFWKKINLLCRQSNFTKDVEQKEATEARTNWPSLEGLQRYISSESCEAMANKEVG